MPKVEVEEPLSSVGIGLDSKTDADACATGSSTKQEVARRRALVALWVLCYAAVGGVLFLSPMVLALMVMATTWKGEINLGVMVALMTLFLLILTVPCCLACCGKKSKHTLLRFAWRRLCFVLAVIFAGCACFIAAFLVLVYSDFSKPLVKLEYDASLPVAVVGGGASGLSSAWVLAHGGRKVSLFEADSKIGGHSQSWTEVGGNVDGSNLTVDLGYIFNSNHNESYVQYKKFTDHFGYARHDTALNTSGGLNGRYWDNTAVGHRYGEALEREIDRFMEFVNEEPTMTRLLTPFGMWMWRQGFSEEFFQLCMDSTMSVLFVTKMGLTRQSTQAVLEFFKRSGGFTHLRYDVPKVQITQGTSQHMWREVVQDMLSTGNLRLQTGKRLTDVYKEDGLWQLRFADGSRAGGFGDVVLALPASASSRVLHGTPIQNGIVAQIDYVEADVTLHTDSDATLGSDFSQASPEVLYFVGRNHMTGRIGAIFGNANSSLLLTVHGQAQEPLRIAPEKRKWTTKWSHHYFSLWELMVARKFLPLFNSLGGMHYAGDWVYGVGHNDAILSGVAAACSAGVPLSPHDPRADPLYSGLLGTVCTCPDNRCSG